MRKRHCRKYIRSQIIASTNKIPKDLELLRRRPIKRLRRDSPKPFRKRTVARRNVAINPFRHGQEDGDVLCTDSLRSIDVNNRRLDTHELVFVGNDVELGEVLEEADAGLATGTFDEVKVGARARVVSRVQAFQHEVDEVGVVVREVDGFGFELEEWAVAHAFEDGRLGQDCRMRGEELSSWPDVEGEHLAFESPVLR